jgi:hypothetical protein
MRQIHKSFFYHIQDYIFLNLDRCYTNDLFTELKKPIAMQETLPRMKFWEFHAESNLMIYEKPKIHVSVNTQESINAMLFETNHK